MNALALIAREDASPLSWLIQAGAVFIFFILPVLRGIAESRKKAAGKAGKAPRRPAAQDSARDGKELWRELLEGRQTRTPPPAPEPRPAQPAVRPSPVASSAPAPAPAPVRTTVARPLAPLEKPVLSQRTAAPARPPIGTLTAAVSTTASPGGALQPLGSDPATLDDELLESWGTSTRPGQVRVVEGLLSGADLRRAVVLSELLAPPLALRGPSASWPGPPMAFGS